MEPIPTRPLGGQTDTPVMPEAPQPTKAEQDDAKTVKVWESRFLSAKKFLDPWFERDQQAFEFYYMWREFRGPYRANIFPPDTHAAIEAVTPRLTKGRPRPIAKAPVGADIEQVRRVQRGHEALWDLMGMDEKWETLTKRGSWFGFGAEKITWKTEGHEEPVYRTQIDYAEDGSATERQVPVMQGVEETDDKGQPRIVEKPVTQFVVDYHGPVSEICDPARVFFPRGYAYVEDLPWVVFQYFKRKSELDPALYGQENIDRLDQTSKTSEDATLDRDKVHRLPRVSQLTGEQNDDNIGRNELDATGLDDDKEDPTIELWEIWERPNRKNPKGRFLTLGNRKVVLRDRPNPMPKGELPLVVFKYIDDTFNLRGIGLAREMERLVLERADKRNQRMDNVTRSIDRMWKVRADEPLEDADLMHRPNGVIRLNDLSAIGTVETGDVTQNAYREDEMVSQDISKVTGANEYVVGGGKRPDEALGQTDLLVSSSNERYDGVIRRLERALNRHSLLVHLLVAENWVESQNLSWEDRDGNAMEGEFNPDDFRAVKTVKYDAKSVIAYKELAKKQGMQLMEVVGKLLGGDPRQLVVMKPILSPLLELFDEIKINPLELMRHIEEYAQAKLSPPPPQPPMAGGVPEGATVPLNAPTPDMSQTLSAVNRV